MADFNSKYTGQQIDSILDLASEGGVALVTISADLTDTEPTITTEEAQTIVDAFDANKLIAIKCGAKLSYGKGWFIPNINIRTQETMKQIFVCGILATFYIEMRIIYDTEANTISVSSNPGELTIQPITELL